MAPCPYVQAPRDPEARSVIGASVGMTPPQVDITGPEGDVTIEVDAVRGVMYVHVEGFTCLRMCRIKGKVIMKATQSRGRETNHFVHNVGGE